MTIILPRFRRQTDYLLRPVRASRVATAGTGGARLPLNRLGDHWAMEISPGVLATACGRALLADIVRGTGETVRAYIPQAGLEPGAAGAPQVAGAGQLGSTLALDGLTAHFVLRKGWFLTVESAVRPSLHLVTEEVVADAAGLVTVSFWPLLRAAPADATPIELVEPWIEGSIDEGGDHEVRGFRAVTLDGFTIEEDG